MVVGRGGVFGNPGPSFIQQDPRLNRRYQMAQALQAQGADTSEVGHPLQALARVVQGGLGGYTAGRVENEAEERGAAFNQSLAQALKASQPWQAPDDVTGPGGNVVVRAGEDAPGTGGTAAMASALMNNPDTAPLGMQMQMGQIGREQELANALTLAREKQKLKAPKTRTVKRDGVEVTEEFDPSTRRWTPVGESGIGLISSDAEAQKARIAAAGKSDTNVNVNVGKGQEAADKEFGKEVSRFLYQGGAADVQKNIAQLQEVRERLASNDNLTGALIGAQPKWLREVVNPASVDTQELVEEVVQRNLREVLGAQFTEKEGQRLIERAYNPSLDEKTNSQRVGRLLNAVEKAYQAKLEAAQYFQDNGTLKGFDSEKLFTIKEIEEAAGLDGEPGEAAKPEPRDFSTMPRDQLFSLDLDELNSVEEIEAYREAIRKATGNGR